MCRSDDQMDGISWLHRLASSKFHVANLARLTKRKVPALSQMILSNPPEMPHNVVVTVLAWEIMTPEQREEWLVAVERETGEVEPIDSELAGALADTQRRHSEKFAR